MIVVSKCLAGEPCRYDGGDNFAPEIRTLVERGEAIAVCPEVLGGLPTPRTPSELQTDGRVDPCHHIGGVIPHDALNNGKRLARKHQLRAHRMAKLVKGDVLQAVRLAKELKPLFRSAEREDFPAFARKDKGAVSPSGALLLPERTSLSSPSLTMAATSGLASPSARAAAW